MAALLFTLTPTAAAILDVDVLKGRDEEIVALPADGDGVHDLRAGAVGIAAGEGVAFLQVVAPADIQPHHGFVLGGLRVEAGLSAHAGGHRDVALIHGGLPRAAAAGLVLPGVARARVVVRLALFIHGGSGVGADAPKLLGIQYHVPGDAHGVLAARKLGGGGQVRHGDGHAARHGGGLRPRAGDGLCGDDVPIHHGFPLEPHIKPAHQLFQRLVGGGHGGLLQYGAEFVLKEPGKAVLLDLHQQRPVIVNLFAEGLGHIGQKFLPQLREGV